jgi:prepilin-type N-terminal cleavage/methylation domain-containing protein/prepilin-type processing-associated H-X9-DG protein
MKNTTRIPATSRGFSLVELLCVITIIAVLASMLSPALQRMRLSAQSVACASNLRQIGIAVNLYVADHDNTYPCIETDPTNPILYPPDMQAQPMLATLQPYGVTEKTLQCPSDLADPNANYFAKKGTSYEWRPILDGENKVNPVMFGRRGAFNASPSRVRQVIDFTPVHNGRMNALYGDGHVRSF